MHFVNLWGRTFDEVIDADKIRLDSPGFPSPMFEYFYVFIKCNMRQHGIHHSTRSPWHAIL